MFNLDSLFRNEDKSILLLRITCLCWLFAKMISWRIWTTDRLLPGIPFFEFLDYVPGVIHTILFALSISLILLLFLKNSKPYLVSLLVIEIISCLLDQNRLQPWEYQYVFTICIFIININNRKNIPSCIAFLLISTYFYSGLGKLNEGFLQTIWNNLVLRSFLRVPAGIAAWKWVHYSGYLLGTIELVAGIGLLFIRTQVKSAKLLIAMHSFILLFLFSSGYKISKVLWPWNILMILLLYFIFLREDKGIPVFQPIIRGANKLVLICWGILPAFSFIGYWDYYLSSNLFSGNLPTLVICVADTANCKPLKRFFYKKDSPNTCQGLIKIDIQNWALLETGVSAYPQVRVYKKMQAKLEKQYAASGLSFVYVTK